MRQTTMSALRNVGRVSGMYPEEIDRFNLQRFHLVKIYSLLVLIFVIFRAFDNYPSLVLSWTPQQEGQENSNSPGISSGDGGTMDGRKGFDTPLHSRVLVGVDFFLAYMLTVPLRIYALFKFRQARNLMQYIAFFLSKFGGRKSHGSTWTSWLCHLGEEMKYKIIAVILAFVCGFSELLIYIKYVNETPQSCLENESLMGHLIPDESHPGVCKVTGQIFGFLASVFIQLAFAYPILFIIFLGSELVTCHELICAKLKILFEIHRRPLTNLVTQPGEEVNTPQEEIIDGGNTFVIQEEGPGHKELISVRLNDVSGEEREIGIYGLAQEFVHLKDIFGEYSRLAGLFGLFIVIQCTRIMAELIVSMTLVHDTVDKGAIFETVVQFVVVCFLACFGDFCKEKMKVNREELEGTLRVLNCDPSKIPVNSNAKNVEEVAQWVVRWKWDFTAWNMFHINCSLIPKVAGALVLFLVVMLELSTLDSTK